MKKELTNKSWLIGFLGFLGFLGLKGEPNLFLFFAFFGGFQYIWLYKLGTNYDERLIENRNKASIKAFQIALIFGLIANIILSFMYIDYEMLYKGSLIIFSLTFAIGVNSWSYLTYKYDKED
ncbi:DUF3796 domain-containing protein [Enterococcus faecium]|uniref:DUF3796 domain-containing protein n=1 Tax=Enterococcus faecium TaxID=1352 RepID=UPI0023B27C71|nr:DUF3796 domain-containing protein [Enterococcus faecium]